MADRSAPETTPPTPLDGAAYALEMCQGALPHATADDLAQAAVIAYLNLTGRDDEAAGLAHGR